MGCLSMFVLLCCCYWTAESCDFRYDLDYSHVGTGKSYTTGIASDGSTYCYNFACIWCFTSWKYSINVLFTSLLATTYDNGPNCTKWRALVEVGSTVVGTYCEHRDMKNIQTDSGIVKVILQRERYARIGHVFLMLRVETSTKGCGGSFSKLSEAVPIAYSSLNSPRKLPTHCLWSFQIPENFLLSLSVLRYEWLCTNSSSKYIHIRTWSDANLWMMYCGHQPEFMFILLKAKFLTITIHHEENLLQTDIVNFLYTISTPGMAQYRSIDTFGKMTFKFGQPSSVPSLQGVAFLRNRLRYSKLYIVSDRQEMQCQGNNITIYYESLRAINSQHIQCKNDVFEFKKGIPVESSVVIVFKNRNPSNRSTLHFSYFVTSMRCGGYHELSSNKPLTISSLQHAGYFADFDFHNCIWIVKSKADAKIVIKIRKMTAQSPDSCSTTNVAIYHGYLKYSNGTKKDGFCSAPVGDITTIGDAMIVLSREKHGYLSFEATVETSSHVYPTISIPRPTEPLKSKSRPPKKIQQTTKNSNSTQINPVVYVAIFFGILSVILIAVLTTIIVRRRIKLATSLDDANCVSEEMRRTNRINSIDPLISIGRTLNRYEEESKFGKRTKEMIEMYESEEDGKVNHGCSSISEKRPGGKFKRNLLYDSCQANGHSAISRKKSSGNMKEGEDKEKKQGQGQGQENNYEDVRKLKVETKQLTKDEEMLDVDVVYEEMTNKGDQNEEETVYANADQSGSGSYTCPESEMQSAYSYVEPTVPSSIQK